MVKANKPKQQIEASEDGDKSWTGSEEGTVKKKCPGDPVPEQIDDPALKNTTVKMAISKTVPSKTKEKKEDGRMLKRTKDGVLKLHIYDKKYDHKSPPKVQFDKYNPFSPNLHHPLVSVIEATGRETIDGKRQTLSMQKGWRSCAISVPYEFWPQSVIPTDDCK